MPNSKQMREARAKVMADAQALLPEDNKITSEIRTKFEAMVADANNMASIISTLETEERSALETRGRDLQLPQVGENSETTSVATTEKRNKEIKTSFRKYLQTGEIETRDLTLTSNGVLIPTLVADPIFAKKYPGSILDIIGKLTTQTGASIKLPSWNDLANSWVLNSVAIAPHDPVIANAGTSSVDDYRFDPLLLDNSLIQDAAFDIEGAVVESISLRYMRDMSKFVTLGNASNIQGLITTATTSQTATTMVLTYADFVNVFALLDPAYSPNACFTMSNATLAAVLKIVDANGRPLFLPYLDGGTSGFAGQILGFPVKLNQYQPNIAVAAQQAWFGDFQQGYLFRTLSSGIVVKRLSERYAELNRTAYVAFTRVGGNVLTAGTPPIIAMLGK